MPLVAHNGLPTFARLAREGETILSPETALHQDIRELHIGLLNMMPDAALAATERQFFRLVGACNQIVQFHVHPFTIPGLERSQEALEYIDRYYESFEKLKTDGLDALIISGANVTRPQLPEESFWQPLTEVFDWAKSNVTSTLCSCLASHALMEYSHGIKRTHLGKKRWGVFSHRLLHRGHPLVNDLNTRFDVPHSRFNEIFRADIEAAGLEVLVESDPAGAHLWVSQDGFRVVYFQGHPEYDLISLLKEYKRETLRYIRGDLSEYPPFPENYFDDDTKRLLNDYRQQIITARNKNLNAPEFPESVIIIKLDITWRDTARALISNWLGWVYQITHNDRRIPFMDRIDPDNPLGLDRPAPARD
ncbi:MAG: homoserine O-succinyltransferase MetA, partial [Methylococcales bacterium]